MSRYPVHPVRMVERLDEQAYLDGCIPVMPHLVLTTDACGHERSDGRLYCRSCSCDVRGRTMAVDADEEEDACHCSGCGRLLAYTLNARSARQSALLMEGSLSGLQGDDRYHLARMIEAAADDPHVLDIGRRACDLLKDF